MRRGVGAAILILALGGSNMVAWMATRPAMGPAGPAFDVSPPGRAQDSSIANTPTPSHAPPRRTAPAPPSFRHDPLRFLSLAPADSLELLSGIGPVLATRLLDARRE